MAKKVLAHGEKILNQSLLYMDGVTVSFEGFKALNNLSLLMESGELRAIIGPNGAGKTTMMDVITGKVRPDAGDVFYNNQTIDLTALDESQIALLGIGRKFQKPTVFDQQTIKNNLYLALKANRGIWATLFFNPSLEQQGVVEQTLNKIKLNDKQDDLAGSLSHGQKQWLEIGMLLTQEPKLLLIDEPAAGMTSNERRQTVEILKKLSEDKSVIVVEHDMEFVKDLECEVTVLHEGSILSEGSIEHVSSNNEVIEVYLGR